MRIYHIAEAAGIKTVLHGGAKSAEGQHFSLAFPEVPIAEYHISSPVGVPLEEAPHVPGTPQPVKGVVRPSDAPGFGYEVQEEWVTPWRYPSGR
jgi:L-rhamnonate dehydratase